MNPLRYLLIGAALTTTVAAQTLVIPSDVDQVTEGAGSTAYPWDRDSATATSNDIRVQYFYDSSNFAVPGPILINQLRFRANATSSSWNGGTYSNCEVRVGDAGVDHAAITTSFDGNWAGGTSPAPAYAGPVTVVPGTGNGTGVPAPWYVTVTLPTPVMYDPTSGADLLIDVMHDGVFSTALGSAALDTARNACSRMYNITDWQATTGSTQQGVGAVVEVGYTPAQGIFASFTVDKSEVGPNETVQFTDTSFTSDPGGIVAWNWDFDNNGTVDSTLQNPTWAFTGCGAQNVSLLVVDAGSAQDTVTNNGVVNVAAPVANFTFVLQTTQAPFILQFTDSSTNAPTAWAWDLDGDGVTDSTAQNPQWSYPVRGLVNVTLHATNSCGSRQVTIPVDTRLQLITQYGGSVGWATPSAFYIDVDVLNPAGLTIEALGVQVQTPAVQADLNVYIKPGRHAGFETDRNAWSLVASGSNPSSGGTPNETTIDISDFSLAPGQWAIALEYLLPSGVRLNYTSGGPTNASNADLALSGGALHSPSFGSSTTFSPRNWNGTVYYAHGEIAGSFSVFADGCAGTSGNSPAIGLQNGGVPTIGQVMTFEMRDAPASQAGAFIFGLTSNPTGLDLSVIGMTGCALYASPHVALGTATDPLGVATYPLGVPNSTALIGARFYLQGFVFDTGANPLGAIVSDAAQAVIGR